MSRSRFTHLNSLVAGITLLAVVVGAVTLSYIEQRFIAGAGESVALLATDIAEKIDLVLYERYGDIQILSDAMREIHDPQQRTRWLSNVMKAYPLYNWLGVTDQHGRIVGATEPSSVGRLMNHTSWFHAVRDRKTIQLGDVDSYSDIEGSEAVAFSGPVLTRGGDSGTEQFDGVVTSRVTVSTLEDIVTETIRTFQNQREFLFAVEYQVMAGDGRVFMDSDLYHKGQVNLKRMGLRSVLLSEHQVSGYVREEQLRRHVEVITGFARTRGHNEFAGMNWTVLVRVDLNALLTPIRLTLIKIGLLTMIVIGPMLWLLIWAIRRLRSEWSSGQEREQYLQEMLQALKDSQTETSHLITHTLDGHITVNQEGIVTSWNPQAERMTGWTAAEAVNGQLATLIIPRRFREAHEQGLRRFLQSGTGPILNKRIEMEALHRDGHEFPVELTILPVMKGDRYLFSAFMRDMTEHRSHEGRQKAEHAITRVMVERDSLEEAASEILRIVCETLDWSIGIMWKADDKRGMLRYVQSWQKSSDPMQEFVRVSAYYTFESGVGLPGRVFQDRSAAWVRDVTTDDNFPRAPFALRTGLRAAFAFPIVVHAQVEAVMEFYAEEFREPDQKILAMFENIAGQFSQFFIRKQAEKALRVAKEQAEKSATEKTRILSTVRAFFIALDEEGVVTEWTSQADGLLGVSMIDAIGKPLSSLPINWQMDVVMDAARRARHNVKEINIENIRIHVAPKPERFLKLCVTPSLEDTGCGLIIMGEDVTERLRMERELSQAQKLESIGQLAAGVAHEINTPTQFVGDNTRFVAESFGDFVKIVESYDHLLEVAKSCQVAPDVVARIEGMRKKADLEYLLDEVPKALQQSLEGIERISKLVRAMKEFAHPGTGEKTAIDLNRAIESTATVARNEWKYVADLVMDLDPAMPTICCLPGEFNQVILNLIVNASHAIADVVKNTGAKGRITISTKCDATAAEIRVADTGTGIPESVRERIFDPFFTTKPVGKGTGQGLAIARSVVVDKHGGTISMESAMGQGTTFIIRLPLNVAEAKERAA